MKNMGVRGLAVLVAAALGVSVAAARYAGPAGASPSRAPAITGLHIVGTRLVNGAGQTVYLHGVNRSGPEYQCIQNNGIFEGPADAASVAAMAAWHINAVRVPLNEDCWLNVNTAGIDRAYVGAPYRQAIINYVNLLNRYGMIADLNLHWSGPGTRQAVGQQPMPDADHTPAFWASVARTFRSNSAVILDLYNEPYPDSDQDTPAAWRCWLQGGPGHAPGSNFSCPGVTYFDANANDTGITYRAAGMQTLVNTVRAAGARQPIMLDGVQYADTLSGWPTHMPSDPLHNLIAGWHPYNFNICGADPDCWNQNVRPVMQQVPVVAGEMGEDDCGHGYIDQVMNWMDVHGGGYLAWTWDAWYGPTCTPGGQWNGQISVISDYSGTPFPTMGTGYRAHLACIAAGTCGPRSSPGAAGVFRRRS